MDYNLNRKPYIKKINPIKNVGIECLKIHRLDSTYPQQSNNIFFNYAVNSWVTGVESENCSYSHLDSKNSANLYVSKCYFHHGFDYGGGGRAYGVMLQATTNECLIENNIFEHLRHSMILQSGANGNVFSYNYSTDPYWNSTPSDFTGDIVLHGNYPYCTLLEQNIFSNIAVDNSHGSNGPYNTFFRNRAEGYGIFFNDNSSPDQNFIGNDISNNSFPYSLVNYTISGTGHFLHGNNNKGTIDPPGTNNLPDSSYIYITKPNYILDHQFSGIGTPNPMNTNNIPAYDRFASNTTPNTDCGTLVTSLYSKEKLHANIYPNPSKGVVNIKNQNIIQKFSVVDLHGKLLMTKKSNKRNEFIDLTNFPSGFYFIAILSATNNNKVYRWIQN